LQNDGETVFTKSQWATAPRVPLVDKGAMQGILEVAGKAAFAEAPTAPTAPDASALTLEAPGVPAGIQLPQVQRRYERDEP
jgi:hypothetical protein